MTPAERKRKQRAAARAAGKCLVCCQRKATNGTKCRICYERTIASNYESRGLTAEDAKGRKRRKKH
jgi:hypothetical protein